MESVATKIRDRDRPCKYCACEFGTVHNVNGQDVMRCNGCGRGLYCVPKTESGKQVRSISTTHEKVSPKQRIRILQRAGGKCEICGRNGCILHVGHVVSVADGHRIGMVDDEINSDENLICSCEECNLGLGSESMPIKLAVNIIRARIQK